MKRVLISCHFRGITTRTRILTNSTTNNHNINNKMKTAPIITMMTATACYGGCNAFYYSTTAFTTTISSSQQHHPRRQLPWRIRHAQNHLWWLSSPSSASPALSRSSTSALWFSSKSTSSHKSKKAAKRKKKNTKKNLLDEKDDNNELTPEEAIFLTTSTTTEEEDATLSSPFATSYHAPVMWKECINGLLGCVRAQQRKQQQEEDDDNDGLIFLDGTLGGGGHSESLLEQLHSGDIVIGCDVDPQAITTASQRLSKYMQNDPNLPAFIPIQSNFAQLTQVILSSSTTNYPKRDNDNDDKIEKSNNIIPLKWNSIDGILLDLGVSSYQIDTPERGFAFMKDGPLDMRMGAAANDNINKSSSQLGLTAADLCNELDENELSKVFKQYGDEPRSRIIAQSIIEHRPLTTTQDLYNAVAAVTPAFNKQSKRKGRTATLARIFQSLRIVVNHEDHVLEQVLEETCPTLLREGGRLVVLSYHSMEDRKVKRLMRDGTTHKVYNTGQDRDIFGKYIGPPRPFKPIGKFQKASDEEVAINPRARSATLRIAERLVVVNDNEEEEEENKDKDSF